MNIKSASLNSVLVVLAFGFTFAGATVARADSSPEIRSSAVSLAGLDLSTPAGANAARERVHEAARVVCNRAKDPYALAPHWDYVNCVASAEKGALQQLKGPAVVASK
jgi:UrcA family protein